jgi:hypothetical protein
MEDRITFGCFFFLSSFLLFFGSRPATNGVGMGFYHLSRVVAFPHVPDPPEGYRVLYRFVAGLIDSYKYVHLTFF